MKRVRLASAGLLLLGVFTAQAGAQTLANDAAAPGAGAVAVTIRIDATQTRGELKPVWRFFGYDEPNYTYMKDGQKLLSELGKLGPEQVYVRCHHLLTSGDGTPALKWGSTGAYREDGQGNPVYNWTIIDRIFDTYLERGLKPYAQIGFMPKDLSTRPDLYPATLDPNKRTKEDGGQAYPPKDFGKWDELVYQWVKHCVDKYGKAEVERWYWEVWNEPNISYWKGTPEQYNKLYDYAVDGVRRALPTARVGGPEQAGGGGRFLRGFLNHCLHETNFATGKTGSPIDFISFHAKGRPEFVNGHVRMGLSNQLMNVESGFGTVAEFPELKNTPIVIGESDPDGLAALPASEAPRNGYRNGTLYSSYTAEAFARELEIADKHGINFEGALTWAFEFENKPYFAGYRVLSTNGIDLPVLNVFRMFGKMGGKRLAVQSSADAGLAQIEKSSVRGEADVYALAGLESHKLSVMVWNYHDDDVPGPAAAVELTLSNLPIESGDATLHHYRIDANHSNAFTVWQQMGSPQNPSGEQYSQLEKAGQLAEPTDAGTVHVNRGNAVLHVTLPRQAVSLLVLVLDFQ